MLDPGESCEDGNVAPGDGCSASCRLEPTGHFKCYRAAVRRESPAFFVREVSLADRFETKPFIARKPVAFCTPVGGVGPVNDPQTHLTVGADGAAYLLPLDTPYCGDGGLDPGEECDDGDLAGGDGCSSACRLEPVQHFKCYRASARFERREATLVDEIETKMHVVAKTTSLCTPVARDGEGVEDPTAHLACHRIRQAPDQSKFTGVDVASQDAFGSHTLTLEKPDSLCVSSTSP